ncbi:hypothetical protein ABNU64_002976 [Acinetobacter baumannii]|nr:hypothetical protein [Acinetobacter baumannii]EKU8078842.1 hypothetical protein [Acinetobacter baumannii]EKV1656336.1 hypothetical protein [Acinetobacter baumannii]EKV1845139.1 hypothetical protein [Acinetobacter baumannii]EKV1975280.1 hypothetical protein [Acinetobacter baumannii]
MSMKKIIEQLYLIIQIKQGHIELNNLQAEAQLPAHLKYVYRKANILITSKNRHQMFPTLVLKILFPLKARLINRIKQKYSTKV